MLKLKVEVFNKGKRVRERLGSRIAPKERKIFEVNANQYMTLKAVKDFEVRILDHNSDIANDVDNDNDSEIDNKHESVSVSNSDNDAVSELDFNSMTIDEVLEAVENGQIDVDKAIALEITGKNRKTLLNKLEELKES